MKNLLKLCHHLSQEEIFYIDNFYGHPGINTEQVGTLAISTIAI